MVASEVKNLASQTAKATEEIAQQVAGIQSSTKSAVDAVKDIANAMRQIDEVTTAIASAVEQQGAATQEISSNVQLAAQGTQTLAGNIASVSGAIGETGRSADAVLTASTTVAEQATRMGEEVRKFFLALRTGPMDRRKGQDENYKGPERRSARAEPGGLTAALTNSDGSLLEREGLSRRHPAPAFLPAHGAAARPAQRSAIFLAVPGYHPA